MRRLLHLGMMVSLLLMATGLAPLRTQAKSSAPQLAQVSSAYDLIAAVNNLRASHGLPAYQTNSILMAVTQAHSEYQASIGQWTHYSADGSRPYQRALAAGYAVAGDLSRGGWFSENVIEGLNLSAQAAVEAWMGDAPHQNTMLSATYRDVGAGVATAGNKVYYTLNAGLATGSPPAAYTPRATGSPKIPIVSTGTLVPNTPNADGSIIHVVRKDDTIYGIAFAYGIPPEQLLRLNGLTLDSVIYVGKQLIIRPVFTPTPTSPTSTPTRRPTATPWLTSTATLTATSTALVATAAPKAAIPISTGLTSVSVIFLLALLIAGALAWLGSRGSK